MGEVDMTEFVGRAGPSSVEIRVDFAQAFVDMHLEHDYDDYLYDGQVQVGDPGDHQGALDVRNGDAVC